MPPKKDELLGRRKAAKLARLGEEPRNKETLDLLTTAAVATQVDTMEKTLDAQRHQLRKMKDQVEEIGGNPELLERITKQICNLDHDVASLRQLVEASGQRDIDLQLDVHQLNANLAEVIKKLIANHQSIRKEVRDVMRAASDELVEKLKRHSSEIIEAIEKKDQHVSTLMCAIRELRFGFEGLSFNTEHFQMSMVRLEDTIARNCRPINLPQPATAEQLDTPESSSSSREPAQGNREPSAVSDDVVSSPALTDSRNTLSDQLEQFRTRVRDLPAAAEYIKTFQEFNDVYKSKQPESETEFIKGFLSAINIHSSCLLQRHLRYRHKVKVITGDVGQQPPAIFIDLSNLRWKDVKRRVHTIGMISVQDAVDRKLSGPTHHKSSTHPGSLEAPSAKLPPAEAEKTSTKRKRTS